MKKPIFLLLSITCFLFAAVCNAQTRAIYTAAGGTSFGGFAGDGLKATNPSVMINRATGVCVDNTGNLYFADNGNARIRKIDAATGIIHTIAGSGINGYSGDGGPALDAQINADVFGLCLDNAGNLYIADQGNNCIRKVDVSTGMITTVVGGGSSTADGVPALSAVIHTPNVYVDVYGNIYFTDVNKIRMVNAATHLVTTIAGNGYPGWSGDGGPASSALVNNPDGITGDAYGNIYFADENNNEIREINTAGIINSIAGTGTAGYSGDGGSAMSARLTTPRAVGVDITGSVYFSDGGLGSNGYIRKVNAATGIITTIAGCTGCSVVGYDTVGTPTKKEIVDGYYLCSDASGNIYYSEYTGLVKMLRNPIYSCDSFFVNVNTLCNGSEITTTTLNYYPGWSIKTYFGDGTSDSSIVIPVIGGTGRTNTIAHTYQTPGIYGITQTLYNGATVVDSLSYSYIYSLCRTLSVKFYYDDNGNCIKDGAETFSSEPILTQVDSNGVTIDTLSATSGFLYDAHGAPGDVYSFKALSTRGGLFASCPSTGIIIDTVIIADTTHPDKYIALSYPPVVLGLPPDIKVGDTIVKVGDTIVKDLVPIYDIRVIDVVPITGPHDQWGNIYVNNNYSTRVDAMVTLHYSTQYNVVGPADYVDVLPTPSSYTDSTITWNVTGLKASKWPIDLYYALFTDHAKGYLSAGDVVHSYVTITPTTDDVDTSNNINIIVDTVRAGCDPNEMSVSPVCVSSGVSPTQLQYTINFQNTGNDTAFNIYVMDTLPSNVDPKSLRIVLASATMNVELRKNGNYNIARFDFPNINLLDSISSPAQSNGDVIFTINTLPGLPDGSNIYNHAGIFFDYNPVVLTNTATTTIGGCQSLSVAAIAPKASATTIYPNPTTDELTIKTDKDAYSSFTISNSIGQAMMQNAITAAQTTLSVKTLPAGLYYITLRGDNGSKTMKFVKM